MIRVDPIAFIARKIVGCDPSRPLIEETGEILGVATITIIDGGVAYIQAAHGEDGRMTMADVRKTMRQLRRYGISKAVWERHTAKGVRRKVLDMEGI